MAEILRVKNRYEKYLLSLPGVVGVGSTDKEIIVYVEKLTPELRTIIPTILEGVPIKIIETGKIRLQSLLIHPLSGLEDRTKRVRPAPGGTSIGHPRVTAGTFSCTVIDRKTGEILGLSNNHVIALNWGEKREGRKNDPIIQPAVADGGDPDNPDDIIGNLERWVTVEPAPYENLVDAAVFKPLPGAVANHVHEVGNIYESIDPRPGMKVIKSGRTTGITYGTIIDTNATIKVTGWGEAIFVDQIIVKQPFAEPGDSGSWVGDAETYRTVGIVFAGSDKVAAINKATHIEKLLDIYIVPPIPRPQIPLYAPLLMLGGLSMLVIGATYRGRR